MTAGTVTTAAPDAAADPGELLLVDKPAGWTSFDVVNKLHRAYGGLKMGHAGTLDPIATGLLIICTGRKRKQIEQYMGLDKEYVATMRLGIVTASYDTETPVLRERPTDGIDEAAVRTAAGAFVGTQQQLPPMWSAVKKDGRRLYELARKGIEVERAPREIRIGSLTVDRVAMPEVVMTVACSKGTYIRTLVYDIGERLGCGGTMTALRRTKIGPYRIEDARTVEELVERAGESRRV
ncbi:MAG: tRNA pseudouridine(55) synthase TruB [Ignavibacteriae bacterium]|nr:tRNA pseudouridine(55) synthase TruB [Ignavibacteriota bacterium]